MSPGITGFFAKIIENLDGNTFNQGHTLKMNTQSSGTIFACGAVLYKLGLFIMVHFVQILKIGLKHCQTFCRWVVLLSVPLQQPTFIPLLSRLSPPPFIFSHIWIPSCHCFTGKSHETGGAAVPADTPVFGAHEGKALQWQLAHHIRGRLYMCVCVCTHVFLRVWVAYMGVQ